MRPDPSVSPGDDGWATPLPFRPEFDYSYEGIMRSYEDSLQRLGMLGSTCCTCMTLAAQLTPTDMGILVAVDGRWWLRALPRLRTGGAVRGIGLGVNEWEVAADALNEAELDAILLAGRYTLLEQTALEPLLDVCARWNRRCRWWRFQFGRASRKR